MNAPAIPASSTNIDNVESNLQNLLNNKTGDVAQYTALLMEAAGYAGQHSDDRHNFVLAQIFQAIGNASSGQTSGVPATDKAMFAYAQKAGLNMEEAGNLSRKIKTLISKNAPEAQVSVA